MKLFRIIRRKLDRIIRPVQRWILNVSLFLLYFPCMGLLKLFGAHRSWLRHDIPLWIDETSAPDPESLKRQS